jgi:hypothetical protein
MCNAETLSAGGNCGMSTNPYDALARCDYEIEQRLIYLRSGESDADPPGVGALLGL